MSKQSINLENVSAATLALDKANLNINDAFRAVKTAADRLSNNWSSRAGSQAQSTMYQFVKDSESRFAVLQNYVSFLRDQVNPGYDSAETTNVKLADQFK